MRLILLASWYDGIFDWIYDAVRKVICWFLDWFSDLAIDAILGVASFLPDSVINLLPVAFMNTHLGCAQLVFPVFEIGTLGVGYCLWKIPFVLLRWILRVLPWTT